MQLLRNDGDSLLVQTKLGPFWVPAQLAPVQKSGLAVVLGEEEFDIYSANSMVQPGDVVMDCGADVCTFVRLALQRGATRVIAVEPSPWTEPSLRKTFAREIEETIALTTIDTIVDELGLRRLDLIKMDIEGSEKPAIEGARRTIHRFKPRFTIATEHNKDDYSAIPGCSGA
jgi:hypothetical protein